MKKIKCKYCGAIIHGKDVFCPNCGKECGTADVQPNDKYYEDVKPADNDKRKKAKMNKDTLIKVGLVVFGFVLVVAACIVALCLL